MRKWLLMLSVVLVFGLVACSEDTSAPADGKEEKTIDEPAEEVLTKALEAAENIESAEVAMEITQLMDVPDQEVSFTTETSTTAQIVIDPLAMYQSGTVTIEADGQSEEQELELYLVDNEMYMYDTIYEQWIKLDASMMPVDQLEQQNPVEQLEMMQSFIGDMEMEEGDDHYTLKITGDGEELMEFTQEAMQEYMDEELISQLEQEGIDIFESMSIQHVYYEIVIDKESYETKNLDLEMEMAIEAEGETLNLAQSVTSEYTGINTVDAIEVPQEALDEAIDLMEELENLEGMDEVPEE